VIHGVLTLATSYVPRLFSEPVKSDGKITKGFMDLAGTVGLQKRRETDIVRRFYCSRRPPNFLASHPPAAVTRLTIPSISRLSAAQNVVSLAH